MTDSTNTKLARQHEQAQQKARDNRAANIRHIALATRNREAAS